MTLAAPAALRQGVLKTSVTFESAFRQSAFHSSLLHEPNCLKREGSIPGVSARQRMRIPE